MIPEDIHRFRNLLMANHPGMRGRLFVDNVTFERWWFSTCPGLTRRVWGTSTRQMAVSDPNLAFALWRYPIPDPLQERDDASPTYSGVLVDAGVTHPRTLPVDSYVLLELGYADSALEIYCETNLRQT